MYQCAGNLHLLIRAFDPFILSVISDVLVLKAAVTLFAWYLFHLLHVPFPTLLFEVTYYFYYFIVILPLPLCT